jgi:hypothetical protein
MLGKPQSGESQNGSMQWSVFRRHGCAAVCAIPRAALSGGRGYPSLIGIKKTRRHGAAGFCLSCVQEDQFGSVADFGFGGNAALVRVPRRRSNAILSALSSLASGGT